MDKDIIELARYLQSGYLPLEDITPQDIGRLARAFLLSLYCRHPNCRCACGHYKKCPEDGSTNDGVK